MAISERPWTDEQRRAIEHRDGDLLLDAAAGSGKTAVLVERFVQSVLQDGLDVPAILTITFTEKAAAEMRERIRRRLRELGALEAARATEGAFISTIHGFCARLLRIHALSAGLDPHFRVLDGLEAHRLADLAFDEALDELGRQEPGGLELISAYGAFGLRSAIGAVHTELRSRGETEPRLPPLGPPPDLEQARSALRGAAAVVARELGAIDAASGRVVEALSRLERCSDLLDVAEPWPAEVGALALPGGNGAALSTATCVEYGAALDRFRAACEHRWAVGTRRLLDELLGRFSAGYARRKHEASAVDFQDLELMTLELLRRDAGRRDRLRMRFARIMVDELQDTNHVQLELIEQIASSNLFTVGDAQQSIYGFRHADVELFEARGRRLEEAGARATLQTNFRSRAEILSVLNSAFASELGERFRPLVAGRVKTVSLEPRVELLLADKAADWESEGVASPWRLAEARALAGRVSELIRGGCAPGDVVVLLRAATDMRLYERSLEEEAIPTYVIGGRGYWSHPQVLDMVAYLRALANPLDVEALYTVLASPLVGVSMDALVVLAAAARAAERDPWWVIREPEGRLDELVAADRERLARLAAWFAEERRASARLGVEQLIDRVLERTGYDDVVLRMPGGQRRLANIRKLMRLGREQDTTGGEPLREFLELVRFRSAAWSAGDASEAEAPVEGDGLNAVRLMTIHRAKGLEFDVVCVADLGRGPHGRSELIRIGRDGRLGLRLAQPGTGRAEPALHYKALGAEHAQAEALEERRLFYVAMTRAKERLILSGAAKLGAWPAGAGGSPVAWIAPALVPEVAQLAAEGAGGVHDGVRVTFVGAQDAGAPPPSAPQEPLELPPPAPRTVLEAPARTVTEISYSSLEEHRRCGYRFYVERVLGLPSLDTGSEAPLDEPSSPGRLSATDRGSLIHELLERLDFRRPVAPSVEAIAQVAPRGLPAQELEEISALVGRFATSPLCSRLGAAISVRTEQRFGFLLNGVLIRGVFDVIARECDGRTLVVDYKSDRLGDADPEAVVGQAYLTQRLIYALAALRSGAPEVEILHLFLDIPDRPAVARLSPADVPRLEEELSGLAAGLLEGRFAVTPQPHRGVCRECPAEGGLCSWPLTATRRSDPGRLF
jgi:ATP-dependent helicase/nuclease subunit A